MANILVHQIVKTVFKVTTVKGVILVIYPQIMLKTYNVQRRNAAMIATFVINTNVANVAIL